jgi:hypothetical protein
MLFTHPSSNEAPTKAWFSIACPDQVSNHLASGLGFPPKNNIPLQYIESPMITVLSAETRERDIIHKNTRENIIRLLSYKHDKSLDR